MVNFGFNSNDDEDEERMAFGNVRDMGIWGTALAVSVALHVVVLGALLCTRGCGPGEAGGDGTPGEGGGEASGEDAGTDRPEGCARRRRPGRLEDLQGAARRFAHAHRTPVRLHGP